jgi:hypothetical protein
MVNKQSGNIKTDKNDGQRTGCQLRPGRSCNGGVQVGYQVGKLYGWKWKSGKRRKKEGPKGKRRELPEEKPRDCQFALAAIQSILEPGKCAV